MLEVPIMRTKLWKTVNSFVIFIYKIVCAFDKAIERIIKLYQPVGTGGDDGAMQTATNHWGNRSVDTFQRIRKYYTTQYFGRGSNRKRAVLSLFFYETRIGFSGR